MTTANPIPATENEAWGFFGGMKDNAELAWPLAISAISDATGEPLESVRVFLDSRHGRHFSDDVRNQMLVGKGIEQAIQGAVNSGCVGAGVKPASTSRHKSGASDAVTAACNFGLRAQREGRPARGQRRSVQGLTEDGF